MEWNTPTYTKLLSLYMYNVLLPSLRIHNNLLHSTIYYSHYYSSIWVNSYNSVIAKIRVIIHFFIWQMNLLLVENAYTVTFSPDLIRSKTISNGISCTRLEALQQKYKYDGYETELYDLSKLKLKENTKLTNSKDILKEEASILIVRQFKFGICLHTIEGELKNIKYDTKCVGRNSAKYTAILTSNSPIQSIQSKDSVYDFNTLEGLNSVKEDLEEVTECFLKGDINYYYNISNCGIGWHGDADRNIVCGFRVGSDMNILFRWYQDRNIVSEHLELILHSGDLYIMSEKAIGTDWKKYAKGLLTLRHAAGSKKYTEIEAQKEVKPTNK